MTDDENEFGPYTAQILDEHDIAVTVDGERLTDPQLVRLLDDTNTTLVDGGGNTERLRTLRLEVDYRMENENDDE